ncbi:MAG TPA: glycosyl hydrolase family 18 protein [Anaerolineae bacterium]|nr:glycosyl hydrolase family 18 protein [Anaerolineae bacterium]
MKSPGWNVVGILYRLFAALATAILLVLNLRLHVPGSASYGPESLGRDIVPQLRFIGAALRAGAGEQMQGLFPEGYFFAHVLYGLAWVDVGLRVSPEAPLYAQALEESEWALARLDSPKGRAPFSPRLAPPYGVFYVGWSNWLRGGRLMLVAPAARPPDEVARFQSDCAALAQAFDQSDSPFLTAYPGQAWPVDSVVAVAALRLHDKLFPAQYTATIERWLTAAQERLDPTTGLLPHRVNPLNGEPLEGARGSSQSIIARFLLEIDPVWGRSQYDVFRQHFIRPFLGASGVLEYPVGVTGQGDVDSGPLVAGFSASATVVGLGAAQVHGDREVADALIRAAEAVGLPFRWAGAKRYAFGLLPVGDAFLVWAKNARPWVASPSVAEFPAVIHPWWRLPIHATALLLILGLWSPCYLASWLRKRRNLAGLMLCVLLAGCIPALPTLPPTPVIPLPPTLHPSTPDFAIVGYLPEYRALDPTWGRYVTDIVYFSASLRADGGLDTTRLDVQTLAALREMRTTYGTRVFVAVGGWDRSQNFAAVAVDPALRASVAQTLTAYCLENGLDGVDFDWEFPEGAAEVAGYGTLLAEVHAAFAPHDLRVSVALASWQDLGKELYAVVDRIHVMAYDHDGRHSMYEQAVEDVQTFLKRGAPPEKLLLGVPFYGRDVRNFSIEQTYAEIVNAHHPAPDVDEAGGIYFNGIATIQQKTRYAQEQGLGGVMIWELGQDTTDDTSLLQAIYQTAMTRP